jgi:hypothetical protein
MPSGWHGKGRKSLARVKALDTSLLAGNGYEGSTLWWNLRRLCDYIDNNAGSLVNYGARYRKGLWNRNLIGSTLMVGLDALLDACREETNNVWVTHSAPPRMSEWFVYRINELRVECYAGWHGYVPGAKPNFYHSWYLEPRGDMCNDVMGEAGVGKNAAPLRMRNEALMHRGRRSIAVKQSNSVTGPEIVIPK